MGNAFKSCRACECDYEPCNWLRFKINRTVTTTYHFLGPSLLAHSKKNNMTYINVVHVPSSQLKFMHRSQQNSATNISARRNTLRGVVKVSSYPSYPLGQKEFDQHRPTSEFLLHLSTVRLHKVDWYNLLESAVIEPEEYKAMMLLERKMLITDPIYQEGVRVDWAGHILNVIDKLEYSMDVAYVLLCVDDMLKKDKRIVYYFNQQDEPFVQLSRHLKDNDMYLVLLDTKLMARLATWSDGRMDEEMLREYLIHLIELISTEVEVHVLEATRSLQIFLRVWEYRKTFVEVNGLSVLVIIVINHDKFNPQVIYQTLFCLWMMTYNSEIAEQIAVYEIVPSLVDILKTTYQMKISRMTVEILVNLASRPTNESTSKDYISVMLKSDILPILEFLKANQLGDLEVQENIEFLEEKLSEAFKYNSSFDAFRDQVESGRLHWSPVHRDAFWSANAHQLDGNNVYLLKKLVAILDQSRDPEVLSVALYDLGEYAKHNPQGKRALTSLGARQKIMQHMKHEDKKVNYEALVAIQKVLMKSKKYSAIVNIS